MDDPPEPGQRPAPGQPDDFLAEIGTKARRRQKAQANGETGVWFGLGMIGLIGWSIVVPTLIGAMLGRWIDGHYRASHAWTLALLVAGMALGCINAWRWIAHQDQRMHEENSDD